MDSIPGVGGLVLLARLRKLVALLERIKWALGFGGGDGGSMNAIETRPAIKETRCWDDRRRGRG